jgi:hypothetical protein
MPTAAKKPTGNVMLCTTSFSGERNGAHQATKGELLRSNHPTVKAFPEFFVPIDDFDRPDVEQATAAPGEKRGE